MTIKKEFYFLKVRYSVDAAGIEVQGDLWDAAMTAAILTVVLGIATKGRYYMKKEAHDIPKEDWIA